MSPISVDYTSDYDVITLSNKTFNRILNRIRIDCRDKVSCGWQQNKLQLNKNMESVIILAIEIV